MYKCDVCGRITDTKIKVCPKCNTTGFTKLKPSEIKLVKKARKTNYLHMKLTKYLVNIKKYAEIGIKEKLDPACVKIFKEIDKFAYDQYQSILAEIETHVNKKKWG